MFPLYILENCNACKACQSACPEKAIHVEVDIKKDGRRILKSYSIDYSKCNECMECVKKCRQKSIIGVEGDKPQGLLELKDLIKLKHELGIESKRKVVFVDECIGCLMCVLTCPVGAISYKDNGKREVRIDVDKCEGCGMCVRNCPSYALDLVEV